MTGTLLSMMDAALSNRRMIKGWDDFDEIQCICSGRF